MDEIKVTRTTHIEWPTPAGQAQVGSIAYVSRDRNMLLESVFMGDADPYTPELRQADKRNGPQRVIRRSEDNGGTWQIVEDWITEEPLEEGLILQRSTPSFFCDSDNGMVLRAFLTQHHRAGVPGWEPSAPERRTRKLFTQVSRDEGRSWSEARQLIVQGDEYNETHWMQGVYFGKNGMVIGGPVIQGREGSVLAPYSGPRLFDNGDIVPPDIPEEMANPDGDKQNVSGCFIGRWRPDGDGLDWTAGASVTLSRKYSCDGCCEPSVDYLPDGRLFMVLRARTYPHTGQELPSLHYFALSSDDGQTWSALEPLIYDDGSYAYSPACYADVLRSSKNGRFYVITNFADAPCINCDPRTKLYIAEINPETCRIRKDTLTIVEQQDKEAGQPDTIRFSNFCWYEDRATRNVVLYMTPSAGNAGRSPQCKVPPHAFCYDIELPA